MDTVQSQSLPTIIVADSGDVSDTTQAQAVKGRDWVTADGGSVRNRPSHKPGKKIHGRSCRVKYHDVLPVRKAYGRRARMQEGQEHTSAPGRKHFVRIRTFEHVRAALHVARRALPLASQ